MGALRTIFRYWLWVFLAMIVVQIGFAGYGAFNAASKTDNGGSLDEDSFNDSFGLHLGFGYLVVLAGLITLLLALAARPGKRRVIHALVISVLLIVQVLVRLRSPGSVRRPAPAERVPDPRRHSRARGARVA